MPARTVRQDLARLLRLAGSNSEAARRIGCSEGWVRQVMNGTLDQVSFSKAQAVAEALRGGRGLDEEWAREDKEREKRRELNQRRGRRRQATHPGRHQVTDDTYTCSYCEGHLQSAHALYLHSVSAHGDRSQGKQMWMTKRNV